MRLLVQIAKGLVSARLCIRSEEHTSELQSQSNLVCRLLLEKKKAYTPSTMPLNTAWASASRRRSVVVRSMTERGPVTLVRVRAQTSRALVGRIKARQCHEPR